MCDIEMITHEKTKLANEQEYKNLLGLEQTQAPQLLVGLANTQRIPTWIIAENQSSITRGIENELLIG